MLLSKDQLLQYDMDSIKIETPTKENFNLN